MEGCKPLADRAMGLRAGRSYGRTIAWLVCIEGRPEAVTDHQKICRQLVGCDAREELGNGVPGEQRSVNEHAAQG